MGTRKILLVVLSILSVTAVLAALTALGLGVPLLRQLIGFVLLTFVPGLLIIKILRIRNLGNIETLLYAVGLSIAFVMLLGLFMNVLYPRIGIPRPISTLPLIVTLTFTVLVLCAIAYFREKREPETDAGLHYSIRAEIFSPPLLFLILLPLLSAVGAYYLANFYQNNVLLLILIAIIAVVAILVAFNKFIPPRLYPLAVLMISISLLWHWSLISQYLWGTDIHHEYYYQNLVLNNGFWNTEIYSNINAMLSITMLAPIYSIILGMDSVWVFKIIYPLLFSLLPLALFQIFRKQTDDRIAFFAVFFFVSFFGFFSTMNQLARQQVAELFLVLFVLLLLDNSIELSKRKLLLIIFGFAIVVSHYGLSYFYLLYLVIALLLMYLMRWNILINFWKGLVAKLHKDNDHIIEEPGKLNRSGAVSSTSLLNATLVFVFIVFCFTWYMYVGAGGPFNAIVNIGLHTYHSLSDLFLIQARESTVLMAVGLASPAPLATSVPRSIFLGVQYCTQFFIVVGVIWLFFNAHKTKFQPVYIAMVSVSSLLLLLCIILPRFSSLFNIDRIYHITLLFLSPFCILGGIAVFRWLFRLAALKRPNAATAGIYLYLVVILVLVPYFLFNTAFIYAVTGDKVTSIALNPELDFPRYNEQEVAGKEWLLSNIEAGSAIVADLYGSKWIIEPPFGKDVLIFWGETAELPDNTCIYLKSMNVKQDKVLQYEQDLSTYTRLTSSTFGREVLARRSKVYDNGGAQVYNTGRSRGSR